MVFSGGIIGHELKYFLRELSTPWLYQVISDSDGVPLCEAGNCFFNSTGPKFFGRTEVEIQPLVFMFHLKSLLEG